MFTSTDQLLSTVKFDFKRIELLRRASYDRNLKINAKLLQKLDEVGSVDELFALQSTSSSAAETRRGTKRKFEEESKSSQSVEQCKKCGCRMLRSVDTGRPDGQNVLECMRTSCLASVKLTDTPAGTVIGKERSWNQKSVYNSLDRYYPTSLYTPTLSDPEELDDTEPQGSRRRPQKEIYSLAAGRSIYVDVPGQGKSARLH